MIYSTTEDLHVFKSEINEKTNRKVIIDQDLSIPSNDDINILLSYGNYDDQISVNVLEQLPNIKWIQVLSSGTEQLPWDFIKDHSILVTTAKGIHGIPISEYVLSMMLYFSKKLHIFKDYQQKKEWVYTEFMGELHRKTLGILGTGFIGREIAYKAKAFDMKVIGVNRSGRDWENFDQVYSLDDWEDILSECDYLCGVLPSTPQTKELINKRTINQMKDGVVIINVGRGDLINEEDLLIALNEGKIAGAGLDVFSEEPLNPESLLWSQKNVFVTPHASALTTMYLPRALDIFYKNYELFNKAKYDQMINRVY